MFSARSGQKVEGNMDTTDITKTKKIDRRVLKTKKAIRIAFARLLAEKDLESITVKELSERADINRKTFYNYYSGVHQVLEEIETDLARTIEEEQKNLDLSLGLDAPGSVYSFLTDILNRDREFYAALLNIGGNRNLLNKVGELLRKAVVELIESQYEGPHWQIEYMAEYAVNGLLAVLQKWLLTGQDISEQEVGAFLGILGLEGFRGWVERIGAKEKNP